MVGHRPAKVRATPVNVQSADAKRAIVEQPCSPAYRRSLPLAPHDEQLGCSTLALLGQGRTLGNSIDVQVWCSLLDVDVSSARRPGFG